MAGAPESKRETKRGRHHPRRVLQLMGRIVGEQRATHLPSSRTPISA